MANQTITTNTNFDTLTGLLAGETVTINSGATLVIDSDPQLNRVLAGNIEINDGTCFIDGTKVRELNFSGASVLPVIGDTLTAGGVTGQVIGVTGTTASGRVRLRSLNGAIANGAALSFTGGKTATAASADRVGWLRVLGAQTRRISTTRLGKIQITGAWYELGVSNGASGQTFQHYTTDICPAVWVETGSGTGIYDIWLNAGGRWSASVGNAGRGRFFGSTHGSATLTFGNGTNGNIPPNGARIRVPNISLGSALTTAPTTGTLPATITDRWGFNTSAAGDLEIDKCLGASFYSEILQAFSVSVFDYATTQYFSVRETATTTLLRRIGVGLATAAIAQQALHFVRCTNGFEAEDLYAAAFSGGLIGTAAYFTDNESLSVKRLTAVVFGRSDPNHDAIEIIKAYDSIFDGVTVIGARLDILESARLEFKDVKYSDTTVGGNSTANAQSAVLLGFGSNSIKIDGISLLSGGSTPRSSIVQTGAVTGLKIRNVGSPSSPLNLQNQAGFLCDTPGGAGIEIARCFIANPRTGLFNSLNDNNGYTILNCAGPDNGAIIKTANNARMSGFRGGLNGIAITTDLTAVYGSHFADGFFTDSTGGIWINGIEKTLAEPSASSYEATSGVRFNSLGGVLLRNVGDRITWTWPWYILGHTAFSNADFRFVGTNQANHDFEYRLDTGSGFGGAWKALSAANLITETISPTTGFRLQIRATCNTANSTNEIRLILVWTDTTATDQLTLYPIDQVEATLSFTGLIPGSEIRIFRNSDSAELAGVESSGTTFSYTYTHEGTDTAVSVNIIKPGYVYQTIPLSLTASSNSLPIQQRVDYSYA